MAKNSHDLRSVFGAAAALESPGERTRFLDEACADQPELRRRVEDLLEAHDQAGTFLDHAALEREGATEGPGTSIGHYKILKQIGEGGFGLVYLAEQTEPVQRRVALKVVKPGMDSREVVARFEVERQALALMDHPNIAHVYDAGTTDSGRPYFVMELVRGLPVTRYCDALDLPIPERLELFRRI